MGHWSGTPEWPTRLLSSSETLDKRIEGPKIAEIREPARMNSRPGLNHEFPEFTYLESTFRTKAYGENLPASQRARRGP